jgi:phosphoserine aminotransferase
MNVTFRLPDEAMEKEFVARAADEGIVELAGHRSVEGIRASIYKAVPLEAVRTLRSFMERFRAATP